MSIRGLAVAAILLGTSSCATDGSLDGLIAFKSAEGCQPERDLAGLIDSVFETRRRGDDDIFVAGAPKVPSDYRARVGALTVIEPEPYFYEATLPLRGTWKGLPVRELYVFGRPESDHQGFAIRFNATPAQLREAANRAGFAIPPSGQRVEEDVLSLYVSVRAVPGGAELACSTG